jgi:hypothetical protein
MRIFDFASRVSHYVRRNGARSAMKRVRVGVRRASYAGKMVVFCCDLQQELPPARHAEPLTVECVHTLAELGAERFRTMTAFWNPKLADRNIRERFAQGASLWLAMAGDDLAGYGWTLQGATIEPYYFPLSQNDVHLFDFTVFAAFRGRAINPFLVTSILVALARGGRTRAFIEAAAWNDAQLASLRKTPFQLLGTVRSLRIAGHPVIWWSGDTRAALTSRSAEPMERSMPNPGPNSERAAH